MKAVPGGIVSRPELERLEWSGQRLERDDAPAVAAGTEFLTVLSDVRAHVEDEVDPLVGKEVLALYSIVDEGGPASFRSTSVLSEPSVWVLHAVMLVLFVHLVGYLAATAAGKDAARRWQLSALAGLASALLTAGLIGQFAFDAAWGSPLSDLVWSFDALMLVETIAALLFAIVLGTPGCEIGVWPELIARARGTRFEPAQWPACLVGLHYLDEWEARHHPRRDRGSTTTSARRVRRRTTDQA